MIRGLVSRQGNKICLYSRKSTLDFESTQHRNERIAGGSFIEGKAAGAWSFLLNLISWPKQRKSEVTSAVSMHAFTTRTGTTITLALFYAWCVRLCKSWLYTRPQVTSCQIDFSILIFYQRGQLCSNSKYFECIANMKHVQANFADMRGLCPS